MVILQKLVSTGQALVHSNKILTHGGTVQSISFVSYAGVSMAGLPCGTYKTYALHLHLRNCLEIAIRRHRLTLCSQD